MTFEKKNVFVTALLDYKLKNYKANMFYAFHFFLFSVYFSMRHALFLLFFANSYSYTIQFISLSHNDVTAFDCLCIVFL